MTLSTLGARISRATAWVVDARTSSAAVLHTLSARIGVTCLNFLTGIIVARSLEAHGRGLQTAVSIWPVVLSGVCTLGIPTALRYYVSQSKDRSRHLFSTALCIAAGTGTLAIVVGVLFIPFWLSKYDAQSIRFAQLTTLFAPFIITTYTVQAFLEARAQFRSSNALAYLPTLGVLVSLLVLVAIHRINPYTSSLAYLVPPAFQSVWRIYTLREYIVFPVPDLRVNARELFSYGFRASAIDMLSTLSTQVDQGLVIRFLSASELGVYTVALAVSRLLNIFSTSLSTVLLPRAAALKEPREIVKLVGRSARIVLAFTAMGSLALSLIAPIIVPFFYGHAFIESVRLTQVLFLEVTVGATINVLAQAFLSTGRPGVVAMLQGFGLLATIPFMLVTIPRFGLMGAAYALLASTTLRLIFILSCFPVLMNVRPPRLLIDKRDIDLVASRLLRRGAA